MKFLFKTLTQLIVLGLCKGYFGILPIDSSPEVCVGRTASLETKIFGDISDTTIQWEKNFEPLYENEHYTISSDATELYVFNALPIHSGEYRASLLKKHASWPPATAIFHLKVIDVHLDVLVESPVVIVRGGIAILKVKKSQEGDLQWRHLGEIVRGSEPHYTFVNSNKTELKIYNAGPEQAGIYEVFIRKRQCEIRKEIEVRILGSRVHIQPINPLNDACVGDKVSFKIDIVGDFNGLELRWLHGSESISQENEHYSLKEKNTVLDVHNILPILAGDYYAYVVTKQDQSVGDMFKYSSFLLKVRDVDLKTLVESPVVMKLGNKATLKVEKSELGTLIWTHDGELVDGKNPHYTFVNSNKTELEINAASLEQAGIYEVLLKEGGCEIRLKIEVQIEELLRDDSEGATTEDSNLLGFFRGDFSSGWYVAPAALLGLVLVVLLSIVCLCRKRRAEKSSETTKKKEDRRDVERGKSVQHVVLREPVYMVQNEPIYAPIGQPYNTYGQIQPITSSHPHSPSLDPYGSRLQYVHASPTHKSRIGPPVQPPTPRAESNLSSRSESD